MLDLTKLRKAVKSLEVSLNEYAVNPNEFVRDSCIQRFEFTYEASWKMLQRYLSDISPDPTYGKITSFPNLIRDGVSKSLLTDFDQWIDYRQSRGTTSHAYDEEKAEEVLDIIPDFLREAKYLLEKLENATS